MDERTRVVLRELAQHAEWDAGHGDAEACARRLREVGRELARGLGGDPDGDTWAHRAVAELAAYCGRAAASWPVDDVAELARLREAALIALAPAPGSSDEARRPDDPAASPSPSPSPSPARPRGAALPHGGRALVIGLAVLGCAALIGIAVAVRGGSHNAATKASSTSPQQPVGLVSRTPGLPSGFTVAPSTSPSSGLGLSGPSASSPSVSGSAFASASPPAESAPAGDSSRVTGIQMTATAADGYPEVQIYGTITASGTGDVTYTVTVAGASGTPQATTDDESGQTSYALSQTLYLQPWCGQKSVTVTVSSGSVSRSASVPVSGC